MNAIKLIRHKTEVEKTTTKAAFARAVGLTPQQLSNMVSANYIPTTKHLVAIAKQLGITVDQAIQPDLEKREII